MPYLHDYYVAPPLHGSLWQFMSGQKVHHFLANWYEAVCKHLATAKVLHCPTITKIIPILVQCHEIALLQQILFLKWFHRGDFMHCCSFRKFIRCSCCVDVLAVFSLCWDHISLRWQISELDIAKLSRPHVLGKRPYHLLEGSLSSVIYCNFLRTCSFLTSICFGINIFTGLTK